MMVGSISVDDLFASCFHAPLQWIPLMKRINVAVEYVYAVVRGDVPMESDSSFGEEDTYSNENEDGSSYD